MAIMPVMPVMPVMPMRALRHPRRPGECHEHRAERVEGGEAGRDQRHPEEDLPGFWAVNRIKTNGNRRGGVVPGRGGVVETSRLERPGYSCMVVASGRGPGLGMKRGQDLVLAKEAGEGGHAGECRGPDKERGRRDRHHPSQATKPPHVDDAPHGMHHRASAQEEQRLEAGMREEVEDGGSEAEQRAGAEACEHVAELADRGIGEHPLEIVLHRANERGQEGRRSADNRYHREGAGAGGKQRR